MTQETTQCSFCDGAGSDPDDVGLQCPSCGGTGGVQATTLPLAELAAKMGKTEDEVKAWLDDTPNRHRRIVDRALVTHDLRRLMRGEPTSKEMPDG